MSESATIFLRKHLKEKIDTIISNCFLNSSIDMGYPYAVLDLKETDDEIFSQYYLTVELWDKTEDTEPIEEKGEEIKQLLKEYTYNNDNFAIVSYFIDKIPIIDEEKTIKRRGLKFDIRVYEII